MKHYYKDAMPYKIADTIFTHEQQNIGIKMYMRKLVKGFNDFQSQEILI